MKPCETCSAPTSVARTCVDPDHTHHICSACAGRFRGGPGEPIRCPEVGWDGRPDPELSRPAAAPAPAQEDEEDEKPPF